MTVDIESEAKQTFDFDYKELICKVIRAVVDYEKCPYEVEVSVLLTTDMQIKELNLEHRGIDAATDVLSFPAVDFAVPSDFCMLERECCILIRIPENFFLEILLCLWNMLQNRQKSTAIQKSANLVFWLRTVCSICLAMTI